MNKNLEFLPLKLSKPCVRLIQHYLWMLNLFPPQGCLYLGPSPSVLDNSFLGKYLITSSNFLASLQNLEYAKLKYFYLLSILGRREFLDVSRIRIVLSIPNIIKHRLHVCWTRGASLLHWLARYKGQCNAGKTCSFGFCFHQRFIITI